jgi:hypothetical protein
MDMRRRAGTVALLAVLLASISCTRSPELFQPGDERIPGQFVVKAKRYILSQTKPGIIQDDSVRYMNDGGSRTFDFRLMIVDRDFFAGKRDLFDASGPDEQREFRDIAWGAVEFIREVEKKQPLSRLYQEHRRIFTAFVRHFPPNQATPAKR